jgi:hypothetical protein
MRRFFRADFSMQIFHADFFRAADFCVQFPEISVQIIFLFNAVLDFFAFSCHCQTAERLSKAALSRIYTHAGATPYSYLPFILIPSLTHPLTSQVRTALRVLAPLLYRVGAASVEAAKSRILDPLLALLPHESGAFDGSEIPGQNHSHQQKILAYIFNATIFEHTHTRNSFSSEYQRCVSRRSACLYCLNIPYFLSPDFVFSHPAQPPRARTPLAVCAPLYAPRPRRYAFWMALLLQSIALCRVYSL